MKRLSWVVLPALLLLLLPAVALAADEGPNGNYKFTFTGQGGAPATLWILNFETKEGKVKGAISGVVDPGLKAATLENVTLTGDNLKFTIKFQGQELTFDGKVPKEKEKKIFGSFMLGRNLTLANLEPTPLKTFDRFEMSKEILNKPDAGGEIFSAALEVFNQVADKKADIKDVRTWADKVYKASEAYGPRWHNDYVMKLAQALVAQEGFAPVAVEYARRAERMMDPKADAPTQLAILSVLVSALKKSGKDEDAKELEGRIAKLEVADYEDYKKNMMSFKHDAFAGRKAKSERIVLVELFTGAQCPPCVAPDLAFEAVSTAYKRTDVVLLQYHLHIPGPDPLTNPDAEARAKYYERFIEGTPTVFFNGKVGAEGGGPQKAAEEKYKEFCDAINPLLEKQAKAKLNVTAVLKGNEITINAKVSDLAEPGDTVKLRLALTEERIRYVGTNGIRYHQNVVRSLPGGAKGLPLTKKTGEQSVTVNLDDLRKKLNKYLDDQAEESGPFNDKPLALKNLKVIAFVQDDDTREILQAIQVDVKP